VRASQVLKLANGVYRRIGEYLPKTGTPSARFQSVAHPSGGDSIEKLLNIALDLTRRHANDYDPWWADTIVAHSEISSMLSQKELNQFIESLKRLGLKFELTNMPGVGTTKHENPPLTFLNKGGMGGFSYKVMK